MLKDPDHGHFVMPKWEFQEIDDASARSYIYDWINKYDVGLVGGCCGLGPKFIRFVSQVVSTGKRKASPTELKALAAQHRLSGRKAKREKEGLKIFPKPHVADEDSYEQKEVRQRS